MSEFYFALFVKWRLALLTWVLLACFICSRLFSNFAKGKPTRPPGSTGRPLAHPMNSMCLYGDIVFVDYGTAARDDNMLELRFALFVKHGVRICKRRA